MRLENSSLKEKLSIFVAEKKTSDELLFKEHNRLTTMVQLLEKKCNENRIKLNNLRNDHNILNEEYLLFLEKYNDMVVCEHTGETFFKGQICNIQQDVIIAVEKSEEIEKGLSIYEE